MIIVTYDILIFYDAIGKITTSKVFFVEIFWRFDFTYHVKKDQNVESVPYKLDFWCSDITYGVKKDWNVKSPIWLLMFSSFSNFWCFDVLFDFRRSDFWRSDPFPFCPKRVQKFLQKNPVFPKKIAPPPYLWNLDGQPLSRYSQIWKEIFNFIFIRGLLSSKLSWNNIKSGN